MLEFFFEFFQMKNFDLHAESWVNEQKIKVSQFGGEEGCHKNLADQWEW
jgi:hypothetical protein